MNAAAQLDQEWSALTQGPLKDALHLWQREQPLLRSFTTPQQLLCFLHNQPPLDTSEPLLALLTLAPDDPLAGRFLLQAILPALKSQAARIVYPAALRDEVWELLLFYAWEAICTYSTKRRRNVAANLVLQVLHQTTRELRRANAHTEDEETGRDYAKALRTLPATSGAPRLAAAMGQPAGGDPIDAETFVLAAASCGWIAERDADLILQNRVDGIPLRLLAQVIGANYQALRKRRQRAERQLRRLLTDSPMSPFPLPRTLTSCTRGKHTARLHAAQKPRQVTPPAGRQLSSATARKETTMRRRAIFAAACTYTTLTVLVMAPDALAATDMNTVIGNLKVWLAGLLASLATVFLITGGARYVMAGGDPMKIEKAKSAISSAGLGYAFALFAPIAVTIIQQIVGG